MSLEVRVFAEVANYEPKPMFGLKWRQFVALLFMIPLGGGAFWLVTWLQMQDGAELSDATNAAMWVMWPFLLPGALYGWVRPKGLMPEVFLGFFFRHVFMKWSVQYADIYESGESVSRSRGRERRGREFRRSVKEHAPRG